MQTNKIKIAIAVLVLVSMSCLCSAPSPDGSGEKIGVATASSSSGSEPTTAAMQTYKAGDIIQVGDSTITMNEFEFQGNVLRVNFTVENKGSADMNVSTILSFEAKDDEGTKLEQEYFDCGSSLDGKILPGDKLKGDICWDGATTDTVKIYYVANLFGSGAVVWEVNK